MPTRRILIVLILLLLGAALFLFLSPGTGIPKTGELAKGANGGLVNPSGPPESNNILSEAKLRAREPKTELSIDEMFGGLNVVLPGLTEFPEQTLRERILVINALLKKSGFKHRLGMDQVVYPSPHLLEKNVPAFSQENVTLRGILHQAEEALDMSYYLSQDGSVLLYEGRGG